MTKAPTPLPMMSSMNFQRNCMMSTNKAMKNDMKNGGRKLLMSSLSN